MKQFLIKLTSRKFLAAVAGFISGLCRVFGLDEGVMTSVSGAVLSGASLVSYIISEGRIDAQRVAEAAKKLQDAVDEIGRD